MVELLGKGDGRLGKILRDLLVGGRHTLDHVAVVHGPPAVLLQPVAGAVVVHVDHPIADGLLGGVERLDADVKISLGLFGAVWRGGQGLSGEVDDRRDDLLRHLQCDLF